ncbi:MAG: prenyltransferase/squalene oxidase repeat-containing protein [Planctomycetota bacterium]
MRAPWLPLALVLAAAASSPAQEQPRPQPAQEKAPKRPDTEAGLRWLAGKQGLDGSWGERDKLALTGMSGLALLASGSTPQRGPYSENIRRALMFVLACQKADGRAFQHPSSGYSAIHNHGYALLFVTQAYGEGGPLDEQLRYAIQQGIKATVASQFTGPEERRDGGFGYFLYRTKGQDKHPNMWKDDEASTTISQVQALRGARNAGFAVPEKSIERAERYIANCAHKPTGGFVYSYGNYRVSFVEGSNRPTFAITAASTAVLHALGTYQGPLVEGGLRYMESFIPPTKRKTPFYYYAHYYAAQVMHMAGGARGKRWLNAILEELAERQRSGGSWGADPEDSLAQGDSEVLNTAWALQVALIERSYLPLHER